MPNWCRNKLTVRGPAADVQRFKEKAVGHSAWSNPEEIHNEPPAVLNFHSLVPIPDDILAAGDEPAGYAWERENWGCKWGAVNSTILDEWAGHVEYQFDTAWSPPVEFLETVAKNWSNLFFILEYEEPGIGFKGLARFQGEVCENHCVAM